MAKKDKETNKRILKITFLPSLIILLVVGICITLCIGRYPVTPPEVLKILLSPIFPISHTWDPILDNLIFQIRLPRIIASILVGGALSLSGAVYQGIFKNPLVSPDFLGVSSGACVGAALAIILGINLHFIPIFAFCGGILAVSITVLIPRLLKNGSNIILVLSGIIVSGLMVSILGAIKYYADPETELAAITYWQLGSFSSIDNSILMIVIPTVLICMGILIAMSWWINLLSLGETDARTLGVNVNMVRGVAIVCSTLLTACSICISGTIGWVGLVIPHLGRMSVGPNNTQLLPASVLMGSLFMLLIDTIARISTTSEIPISILTGLIGAPFYAWVLYHQRMRLQ